MKATIPPELRQAFETGAGDKELEDQFLATTIKNVFGAPAPPEGTTYCYDGEDISRGSVGEGNVGRYSSWG